MKNCITKTIDNELEKVDNILVLVALQIAHITNTYIQSSKQRVDLTIYPFYFYIFIYLTHCTKLYNKNY